MRDEQKTKAQLLSELQAARQSEELYRQLFEGANDAIITFTLEGIVTRVNRGLEVMLGWSREELIGQHYRKFVAPASVTLGAERTRRFLAGDRLPSIFEAEVMRKDGKVVPVEIRTRPIRDTAGKPVGMQGIYRDITARKQAEDALRRSEQFKTLLITQCPLGIATYAPNGDVTMVNEAFTEMWGVSWERVKDYNLFIDPQLCGTPLWAALQHLTEKGGAAQSFELQYDMDYLVPGRGKKWISAKYYAVQDDDGNIVSLVCFSEDITGRKQAEEALRERELRLRTILSSMPVSLWAVDRAGVFTFVQGKDSDPLGNSYGNLAGRSVFEVYRDAPQLLENMRRALAGEALLQTIEVGGVVFEIHHTLLRDQQGAIDGVIGVSIDITERKRMEESLRASEERYRNLFENANDAIVIVGLDRTILSVNRAMEQMLGWSREELIGQSDRKVLTPAGIALAEERERRIQQGEKVSSIFEHEFVRKDGSKVLVEGRTRFIKDRTGKPIGFQGIYRDITARKRAEEALRQSESKYRLLTEQAVDAIWIVDQQGNFLTANSRACEMLGYTQEELLRLNLTDLLLPDDLATDPIPWDELLAGNIAQRERRLRRKDGTLLPVETRAKMFEDGKFQTITRDITERKRAEEALQESEQRYRTVSELISDYAYAVRIESDWTYTIEWFTETFTRVTGFTLEKGLHTPGAWQILVDPADLSIVLERIQKLMSGQTDVSEFRIITKNKESRWVQEYGRPIWDEAQGRVTHIYIAGRDVTERKLMEELLRNSEQRYRGLVESQQDLIVRVDPQGHLTFVNDAYCKKFAKQREELIGTSFMPLVHEDDRAATLETMKRLEAPPYRVSLEQRALTAEGWRWFAWEDYAIRDDQGRTLEIQAVGRDITDRQQAEAEKQQLQEQLFQARKLEALGTLAGGVAHDFNNILSAIMGFTELAADDVPPETVAHRNLQEVLKASRRARTLVQQVLTFSRPYDRQHIAPAQLPPIIEEVMTFLRASLPLNVELHQHLDLTVGSVTISQGHLHQMLTNLCQNAVQALDSTGGHIEVGLQQIEVGKDTLSLPKNLTPGSYLHWTVRDTGHGMPPEIQERIFEPFFTTRPVGEGNGLGLAIVHGIVMGYGGAITVASVVGQGTTFHIYLPVAENSRGAEAPRLTPASQVEAPVVEEGETGHATHFSH